MMNTFLILGRYVTSEVLDEKNNTAIIVLEATDPTNDKFPLSFIISKDLSEQCSKYCHKNDLVGIKGFISLEDDEIKLVSTKISFMARESDNDD